MVAAPAATAHETKRQIVPEARVELSFGRSEDYDYDPPEPGTYRLPPIKTAGNGRVLDAQGRVWHLYDLYQGYLTVLAFIYTRCSDPKGCPLSVGLLYDLLHVSRQDPMIGDNVRLIALSFDYAHDTPEVLRDYASGSKQRRDAQLLFLTTQSETELAPILKAYDQPIGKKSDADDPYGPFTHQLRVYLIDRARQIRNIYSLGFLDPRLVITDIRTLLLEELGEAPDG